MYEVEVEFVQKHIKMSSVRTESSEEIGKLRVIQRHQVLPQIRHRMEDFEDFRTTYHLKVSGKKLAQEKSER